MGGREHDRERERVGGRRVEMGPGAALTAEAAVRVAAVQHSMDAEAAGLLHDPLARSGLGGERTADRACVESIRILVERRRSGRRDGGESMMRVLSLCVLGGFAVWGADQATLDRGQKEEQRQCVACHSLRIIHSQRLGRPAWTRELDKMAGWGTKYTDRDALLEYLVANFGDDKPMAPPAISEDGRAKK